MRRETRGLWWAAVVAAVLHSSTPGSAAFHVLFFFYSHDFYVQELRDAELSSSGCPMERGTRRDREGEINVGYIIHVGMFLSSFLCLSLQDTDLNVFFSLKESIMIILIH